MSAALVSQFYDVGDVIRQNIKNNQLKQMTAERRITTTGATINMQRNRNFSTGNVPPILTTGNSQVSVISLDNQALVQEHRKLDRSYSEPCDKTNNADYSNLNLNQKNNAVNSSRYKTELCRPFEESGHCKYADKCQFAHGAHELRSLARHPKYKTELCRTFHSKGFCPYGPRCNFIHNEDLRKLNQIVQQNKLTQNQNQSTLISPPSLSQSPPPMAQRPTSINFNSSFNGSLSSTAESSPPSSVGSESPSLSPVFFAEEVQQQTLNPCTGLPNFMPNPLNLDNTVNNTVFNISDLASALDMSAPLNVQTQQITPDLNVLQQQFNAILNLNINVNQSNNNNPSVFGEWDPALVGGPLSSPDSISGDSVGSSYSSASNTECGSPSESGKNFRLPVFNHISQDV